MYDKYDSLMNDEDLCRVEDEGELLSIAQV